MEQAPIKPIEQASSATHSSTWQSLTPLSAWLQGWRHSAVWNYAIMLITSVIALGVSFILAAETLQLARAPHQLLSCDINAAVSCSTVAKSWQAEIIHIAGLSFPNAYFGIAAESVFTTLAVLGLIGVRVPRWFATATWFGALAALAYAYWLFTQSVFVINVLCPWCLLLMFATTVQCMAVSHASVTVQHLPAKARGLLRWYQLHYDLMADAAWISILIAIIIVRDGAALFG